jgi:hypothetical protein
MGQVNKIFPNHRSQKPSATAKINICQFSTWPFSDQTLAGTSNSVRKNTSPNTALGQTL